MDPVDKNPQDDPDGDKDEKPVDPTGEYDALDISEETTDQGCLVLRVSRPYGGRLRSISFLVHSRQILMLFIRSSMGTVVC